MPRGRRAPAERRHVVADHPRQVLHYLPITRSAECDDAGNVLSAGYVSTLQGSRRFSSDRFLWSVRRFKPTPEAYRYVADTLVVPLDQLRLVAAHAWDIVGARRAGCAAAFVARPGKVLYPLGPQPDIIGRDFRAAAEAIVGAVHRDSRPHPDTDARPAP